MIIAIAAKQRFTHHWQMRLHAAVVSVLVMAMCVLSTAAGAAWQTLEVNDVVVANGHYGYQWAHRHTSVLNRANAVASDASGNVYAAGYRDDNTSPSLLSDVVVTQHSPQGALLWESLPEDCPGLAVQRCNDKGLGLAVDQSTGEIYVLVSGNQGVNTGYDFVVLKYDPAVSQQPAWVSERYDFNGAEDVPLAIKLAADGSGFYVVGHSDNGVDNDVVTVAFDSTGAIAWSARYDSTGEDRPTDFLLDSSGQVYVLANSNGNRKSAALIKYSATGVEQWVKDDGHMTNANAYAMVKNSAGEIYVTGAVKGTLAGSAGVRDVMMLKYHPDTGAILASAVFDSGAGHDIGAAITIGSDGAVYVGAVVGGGSDYDVMVVKFDDSLQLLLKSAALDFGDDDGPGPGWVDSDHDAPGPADIFVDASGRIFLLASVGGFSAHDIGLFVMDASLALSDSITKSFAGNELVTGSAMVTDAYGDPAIVVAAVSDRVNNGEEDYAVLRYALMETELTVGSVTAPAVWPYGAQVTLQSTTNNIKNVLAGQFVDAGSYVIQYSLVSDQGVVIPLVASQVPGLVSGASHNDTTIYDLVAESIPLGIYTLRAEVDSLQQVVEKNESNNIIDGGVIEIFNPPDLVATAVTGPASVAAAASMTVEYTVVNQRPVAAGTFSVSFFLSQDDVAGNGDDIALTGEAAVAALAGGASTDNGDGSRQQVVVTVANTVTPGNYRLIAVADSGDTILEAREDNNTYINTQDSVAVQAIADLSMAAVSGPLGAVVGQLITVSDTVAATAAGGDAAAFTVGLYLSTDVLVTNTDLRLGERSVSGLVAGNSSPGSTDVTIPATGLAAGIYYLGAIADDGAVIAESNETNNAGVSATAISIGLPAGDPGALPDLVVSTLAGPTTAVRGSVITVTPTVQNILPTHITVPFGVGVYISSDSLITTADKLLGTYTINGLLGNTSDIRPVDVTIPDSVTSPITWTDLVRASVDVNNTLIAGAGTSNSSAGAASAESIAGDGAAEFTVIERDTLRAFGLSDVNLDDQISSIDYGIYLLTPAVGGGMQVVEGGVRLTPKYTYATGDVLRIERIAGVVKFLRNGTVFYTSTIPSAGPLIVDVAFKTDGATIADGKITNIEVANGAYYLGAIADYDGQIAELSDNNNSVVQTDGSGSAQSTVVSVSGAGKQSGGGAVSVVDMLMLLLSILLLPVLGRSYRNRGAGYNKKPA